jgi:hypothetical protein
LPSDFRRYILQGMRIRLVMGVALLLLPACSDSTGPLPELVPLVVGATTYYVGGTTDPSGIMGPALVDSLHILGDTTMDGSKWYEINHSAMFASFQGRGFLANRNGGVWLRTITNTGVPQLDQPVDHLYFRYPAHVGDRYEVDPLSFVHPFVVAATSEPCGDATLTQGCIRYQEDQSTLPRMTYEVRPGLGIVTFEIPGPAIVDSTGHLRQAVTQYELVATQNSGP